MYMHSYIATAIIIDDHIIWKKRFTHNVATQEKFANEQEQPLHTEINEKLYCLLRIHENYRRFIIKGI